MQPLNTNLNRDEMIALVTRIRKVQGSREEINHAVRLFVANCRHPSKSDLIFYPNGHPHDRSKPEPTVEAIVDRAMSGGSA